MSTTDCRPTHIYRLPVYQQRALGIDNNPHVRSSSPNKSGLASRRRHSTPPASNKYLVDVNSLPSNAFLKYYHSQPRAAAGVNKERKPVSESRRPPSRPISLVKPRHQDERVVRIPTTPTSVKSFTDVILPVAKKNRNTIVETPSSLPAEIQSINRNMSTAKRGKATSLNLEYDISVSDEDSYEKLAQDNTTKLHSVKWCHAKCPCRFSHCNLCHWYCSCPFCCWIACFLFVLALLTGLFLSVRFLSN